MNGIKKDFSNLLSKVMTAAEGCGRDPDSITIIGVSKGKGVEAMIKAIEAGCNNIGENYIQEAVKKIDIIGKKRVCWHFIGHLQSNKVKLAVKYFDYIHTVDNIKLAQQINKQAKRINKIQNILIQINIADEITKFGIKPDATVEFIEKLFGFENLSVRGLMCIPPYFEDNEKSRIYFRRLVQLQQKILDKYLNRIDQDFMSHLSMGMSNDFSVAIEEGATMIRVGTAIFGGRD